MEKRTQKFILHVIDIYNEIFNYEYKICFFLFNSTKNTDIFNTVFEDMLIKSCDSPETFFLYVILNNLGFITKKELVLYYENREPPKSLDIQNLIKELRFEINNFIYTDIYKLFVILYYIKFDKLCKDDASFYPILQDKDFIKFVKKTKLKIELGAEKIVRNRDSSVNIQISSNLFCFFHYLMRYQYFFVKKRDIIYQVCNGLFLIIFDCRDIKSILKIENESKNSVVDMADLKEMFNDTMI